MLVLFWLPSTAEVTQNTFTENIVHRYIVDTFQFPKHVKMIVFPINKEEIKDRLKLNCSLLNANIYLLFLCN